MGYKKLVYAVVMSSVLFASAGWASKEAFIKNENGEKMQKISNSRVTGRLSQLEKFDDDMMLCYEGSEKDICEILSIAVIEENEKEKHEGKFAWKLKHCRLGKDSHYWGGTPHISFEISRRESEHHRDFLSNHMITCTELEKIR